jgi:K(+)-stimulated pyrophosphate-energized sodium pump
MHRFSLAATLLWQTAPAAATSSSDQKYLWIALAIGVLGLVAALMFARSVLASDSGTSEMQAISDAIREGAEAFMKRQYGTIAVLAIVIAILLYGGYSISPRTAPYAAVTVISFLIGAVCSGFAGYTGMYVSIRANIRTASAARTSLNRAIQSALRGGAVTGLIVVALALIGLGLLFIAFGGFNHPQEVPYRLVGFGFGASLVALFAQLGGGIYTKAADVGADLVGKVEAGIPEDDPRNPAVIADLVGDNVGDCAGRGADIFESTAAESVGAMILGAALYPVFGLKGVLFPLVVHAINLIASTIGVMVVHSKENEEPMHALNRGYYVTSLLAIAGFAIAVYFMLGARWWLFGCGILGMATSYLFVVITEYYTESRYRPVQSIAKASLTGPATNIISGLAVGMETPAVPVLVISAALLLSYYFGVRGLEDAHVSNYAKGIYGTAIATMGMLSSAAYILAMDTFGPITDNAGGIIEMSNQPESIRERTDKLDAAGNTTKALTKGYAVGSAALAAFLLFSAYLEEIRNVVIDRVNVPGGYMPAGWSFDNINLASVPVFVGALLSRHHARHQQAGLWPLRFHRHQSGTKRNGAPRNAGRTAAVGCGRSLPPLQHLLPRRFRNQHAVDLRCPRQPQRRRSRSRPAHGRHHHRNPDGHADEQWRRRLGQRQKVHRKRSIRRQTLRRPQSRSSRRHRRRPFQRHRRPLAARPNQTAGDDHAGASTAVFVG